MRLLDHLKNGIVGLQSYKLRALLTTLGIIFGVSAVISTLAIGEGARKEALDSIRQIGIDNILVKNGDGNRLSSGLSTGDIKSLTGIIPQILGALSIERLGSLEASAGDARSDTEVYGIDGNLAEILDLGLKEGEFFLEKDHRKFNRVCIIGSEVKRDLFGFSTALGHQIRIEGGQVLEIIGTMKPVLGGKSESSSILFEKPNRNIYIPLNTLYARFARISSRGSLDEAILHLSGEGKMFEAAHIISRLIKQRHYGEEDFTLVVPEALLKQMQKTQRIFSLVMGCIAGISLLVGGIGIMNIMLATVTERTREIGIRRAVGATQKDIMSQFLAESVLISITGGSIGVLLGIALSSIISKLAGWQTIISAPSIFIAVAVSVAVGLIFGVYPAGKAARLKPIEALRYE